ncbi:MAG: hypothetical protein PVF37_06585 [Desulfobacterales bacterium]|jgi:hypothetical protein
MSKYNKLTSIEILLILAIIAVLAVWLLPRFLKLIHSDSRTIGSVRPSMAEASETAIPAPSLIKFRDLYYYSTADIG